MFAQLAVFDWLKSIDPAAFVFIMSGVVAVAAIGFPQWRQVRQNESTSRLKQKMVDRGYSADEIERVLKAGEEDETTHS